MDNIAIELVPIATKLNAKGFKVIGGIYSKESFICTLVFDNSVDMFELHKALNLPQQETRTNDLCTSRDESWMLVRDENGRITLTLGKERHLAVLVFILSQS